ncbi:hypothetical protein [Pedobacter sp. MR2016-24]|uniref:hypothetical protein n=1 Tax=Pedobacter sp. MR2016-24 TaxID=2994466 RepID=UPI0022477A51|nr:hypothetical protein [Pedobacter sp. MR2016-24]MCX2486594.1 hypothetical protein [Pedobacter sp. MR2016-24]
MEKIHIELVETVEQIKDELYAIFNRKQNKMNAELKMKAKRVQDIRIQIGMLQNNNTSWTCPDCIYTTISMSMIPFLESSKYLVLLNEYKALQEPKVVEEVITPVEEVKPPEPVKKSGRKKK